MNAAYVAAVLASSPRAYYQCQEASGLPQDSSGNGLHMTAGSAFAYQQAGPMADYGIRYSGGQGHTRSQVTAVVNNLSFEFWFRGVTFVLDGQHLVINHAATNGYLIGFQGTTGKWFIVCPNVANQAFSAGVLAVGVWKHVVCTRDAGTWKYYLNGAVDTANAGTSAPNAPSGANTGIHNNTASLDGVYAHVAIYETALSAATVAAHYAAATALEGTGYRRLYGPTQLPTSAATIFTVPTGKRVQLRSVYLNNPTGSTVKATMSVGADAAGTRVYDLFDIPAGESVQGGRFTNHTLEAGETLQAYADTASAAVLTVDGHVVGI